MANSFYDHTTFPVPNAAGTSKSMRDELDAIEAGFDKFPQLTSSVSGLVLKVNSGGTAIETSSALSSFTISSSDLTACTLNDTTMSAATINNLSATNISATGTFYISANPTGKLLNVHFGSANASSKGDVHATDITASDIQASSMTITSTSSSGPGEGANFPNGWSFKWNAFSGGGTSAFQLGNGAQSILSNRARFNKVWATQTSSFTYITPYHTGSGSGPVSGEFLIDCTAGLIYMLNSATTTLGAVNKGQLDTQINIIDNAKFDKAGGTVSGTANFTEHVNIFADLDLINHNIDNVASATLGHQAVNKNQMDYRVDTAVADLVSSAPSLLNSLSELAAALNNDESFANNMVSALGTKITTDGSNQMLADLNLNSNNIINLATATASHHAINKAQLDAEASIRSLADTDLNTRKLEITGGSVTGNINLSATASITNAATVSAGTTGTTLSSKQYVDRKSIALQMVYSI